MRMRKARARLQHHPLFFLLMALVAMAELGLTAFLINGGNENHSWQGTRLHNLLILTCFNASWTTLFATSYILWAIDGSVHVLANVASSAAWLFINTALWAASTGFTHHSRQGGNCSGTPIISSCRQLLTVEALGWTEVGLSAITMLTTCVWIGLSSRRQRSSIVSDSRRFV